MAAAYILVLFAVLNSGPQFAYKFYSTQEKCEAKAQEITAQFPNAYVTCIPDREI